MKTLILFCLTILIAIQIKAQQSDSTQLNKGKSSTFRLGNMKITVDEDDDKNDSINKKEKELTFSAGLGDAKYDSTKTKKNRKQKDHVPNYWKGFGIGTNGFLTASQSLSMPAGYGFLELNQGKSIGVELNFAEFDFNLYQKYVHLITGMGLEWNNYRFSNDITLYPDSNRVSSSPSLYGLRKNKLTASYLNVPILLGINSNPKSKRHFTFATGVVFGLNLASHTKQVYEIAGKTYKDKVYDDFNLAPFKYDATVRIGYRNLSLFANYDMIEMFRPGRGPELHPFTVGLHLN